MAVGTKGSLTVSALSKLRATDVDELCALKNQHWPHSLESQRAWWARNSSESDLIVRIHGDRLRAFLRMRERIVEIDGRRTPSLCVTEVSVDRVYQRHGMGARLLETAATIARERRAIGYLLCRTEQAMFYAKCGWSRYLGAVSIRSTSGSVRALTPNELCFVADPEAAFRKQLVLVGDVF